MLDAMELTGRSDRHIVILPGFGCGVHKAAIDPFIEMRRAAAQDGIDLCACSAFRSFDDQRRIWNAKYRGERPLYLPDGTIVQHATLDEEALLASILRWSALPGASRHHWGTDIDVIDRSAPPPDYAVRLMPDEFEAGGVFERLGRWIEAHPGRFDFFRPYAAYNGGVEREPWHLSYAPVAVPALEALTPDLLTEAIADRDVLGKERVLAEMPAIYARYVTNISMAP